MIEPYPLLAMTGPRSAQPVAHMGSDAQHDPDLRASPRPRMRARYAYVIPTRRRVPSDHEALGVR